MEKNNLFKGGRFDEIYFHATSKTNAEIQSEQTETFYLHNVIVSNICLVDLWRQR